MGTVFSGLTKSDISSIQEAGSGFKEEEIREFYKRFRELDRDEIGRVYTGRLLCIPEININPLGEKVVKQMCLEESAVDFGGFLKILKIFSAHATNKERLEFFIKVISPSGRIARKDLEDIAADLYAGMYTKEEIASAIEEVFEVYDSGKKNYIEYKDLEGVDSSGFKFL